MVLPPALLMVRTGRLSMQERKGVRLGPTPGRNRNASNSPGQQSTVLHNEHSQRLPKGLHEEHVKATASCCAPVTWTFSALEYLSLSSTTSQSTQHRECRGNSFRKLTWQHKELIIFLFCFVFPLTLVQRRDASSGS